MLALEAREAREVDSLTESASGIFEEVEAGAEGGAGRAVRSGGGPLA